MSSAIVQKTRDNAGFIASDSPVKACAADTICLGHFNVTCSEQSAHSYLVPGKDCMVNGSVTLIIPCIDISPCLNQLIN